jgi:hypothetical protein
MPGMYAVGRIEINEALSASSVAGFAWLIPAPARSR